MAPALRQAPRHLFTSRQMKLGALLNSWFLGLSVGGARLVSDRVLLFRKKKKNLYSGFFKCALWGGDVGSLGARRVSGTQWEGVALPQPF